MDLNPPQQTERSDLTRRSPRVEAPTWGTFIGLAVLLHAAINNDSWYRYLAIMGLLCFAPWLTEFWMQYRRRQHKHRV